MRYFKAGMLRLSALIHCLFVKSIYGKRFTFKMESIIAASVRFSFESEGCIHLGNGVGIRRGTELTAADHGKIIIGDKCFLNKNCLIASHEKIEIGERTKIGPNVLIYDHDYVYKDRELFLKGEHKCQPVTIGKRCWIGAGTIILKGSVLGDDCVVGAGCVVKGHIPSGTMMIQPRENEMIKL